MPKLITNYRQELIILMISIMFIGLLIIIVSALTNKKKQELIPKDNNGLNDNDITKIDQTLSKEELTTEIFNLYKKIEIAKSKFQYDTLKELLTDELYSQVEQQLEELKANKQKLVATNIQLQNIKILDIHPQEEKEIITANLHVSQYDYIIDNKKNLIRGTDQDQYQIEYRLTIEKNKNKYFLSKLETTGKWIKTN